MGLEPEKSYSREGSGFLGLSHMMRHVFFVPEDPHVRKGNEKQNIFLVNSIVLVKLDHFPKDRGENQKMLKTNHLEEPNFHVSNKLLSQ